MGDEFRLVYVLKWMDLLKTIRELVPTVADEPAISSSWR